MWSDRSIGPGSQFDEAIAEALRAAPAVVVLWTHTSVASEWVREEASEAKRRNVLVPVILESVDLPLGFTLRQAVDLTHWNGSPDAPEFASLIAAIDAIAAPPGLSATSFPPVPDEHLTLGRIAARENPTPRRRITPAVVTVLGIFALGLGSGLWYLDAYYLERVEQFASVTKRWGFPEGIGRLSAASVKRRNVSIALTRHGRRNPVDELRLVSATGSTPPENAYVPPLALSDLHPVPGRFNLDDPTNPMTITRLTFSRDSAGRILEQKAFSRGGRLIYTLHFATPDLGEFKRYGLNVQASDSGISYLRFLRATTGPYAGLDQEIRYIDEKGRPEPDANGEYGLRMVLNALGLATERTSLGPDFTDYPNSFGVLREVRTFDGLGNLLESSTLDTYGLLSEGRLGPARLSALYDTVGNLTQISFHDTAGRLLVVAALGAAGRTFTYDSRGNITSTAYFGPDRELVSGSPGFARQTVEWLAPNRALSRFFGPGGRPTPAFGGAFEGLVTYDSRGLSIESTFRDASGAPTRTEDGCSTYRMAYDDVGNIVDSLCLDEGGTPTFTTTGYARARMTYDEFGNVLTTRLFDRQDQPGLQGESYTSLHEEYNEFHKIAKRVYRNARGEKQRLRNGYAAVAYTYDSRGNQTSEMYLDEENHPIASVRGYAAIKSTFDDRGRSIESAYLGADGRPVLNDEGYAIARFVYEASGQIERVVLLDEREKAVRGVDGFASYLLKRNPSGQRTEIVYYDERGNVTLTRRPGSAIRRWTVDGSGRVLERADYDPDGRPMMNEHGYSVMTFSYDEFGRETGRGLLDRARRPLAMKVGVSKVLHGSVGADADLRAGDVVLTYAGIPVETTYQFTTKLELFKGDKARDLTIPRGDRVLTVSIPPGRLNGVELLEMAR